MSRDIIVSILIIAIAAINLSLIFAQSSFAATSATIAVIDTGLPATAPGDYTLKRASNSAHDREHGQNIVNTIRYYAPSARVIAYDCGVAGGIDLACAASSVQDAINTGARIINLSFALDVEPNEYTLSLWNPALESAAAHSVLVYAASGNRPPRAGFPSTHALVISVGYDSRQNPQIIGDEDIPVPGGVCSGSSCTTALVSALASLQINQAPRSGYVAVPGDSESAAAYGPAKRPTASRPAAKKSHYRATYQRYHKRVLVNIRGKKGVYQVRIGKKTYKVRNKRGQVNKFVKIKNGPKTIRVKPAGARKWQTIRVSTI